MYKKQKTKKGKQSTALWQQHQEQSSSTTQIETCSTAKLTDLLPRKRMGQNHNIPFLRCKQSHRKHRLVRLAGWLAGWLISRERKILLAEWLADFA